jgi:ribosomal protein L12E/L44/L45/RPP1/RPP2
VLAAERYMGGHQSLRELRHAVTGPLAAAAAAATKQDEQRPEAANTARCECQETRNEESFEDRAVSSRVAVDLMWP